MRYAPGHKARSHDNILTVAARSFREHGADASGIGTVMKKVGLTKGGFYRHFRSKDDLFVEAVARAFDQMGDGMVKIAESAPKGQALRAMIEYYLSPRHAASPGLGCVLAALAPEIARKPIAVRRRIEASMNAYRERLLPYMPGATREKKLATLRVLFAGMMGVLIMARTTADPQLQESIVKDARAFYLERFASV